MKIISWNLNGIRSLKNGIKEVIDNLSADIICLQEIKAARSSLDDTIINVPGYSSYFSLPKHLSGYSGVATFCRNEVRPISAEEGLSGEFIPSGNISDAVGFWPDLGDHSDLELKALESEGRAVITKHSIQHNHKTRDLVIINVYCPCVDPTKPERAVFQLNFHKLLQKRATELYRSGCCVIILGDLNVARHPVDHCDPGNHEEFSQRPSRLLLNNFLQPVEATSTSNSNFIDTFRHFHPAKKHAYTCWNTLTGARKTNYGTRIDYVLIDKSAIHFLQDAFIMQEFEGSDHCPVGITLNCKPTAADRCPSICTKYWPEFAGKQKKLTAFLITPKEEVELTRATKRQKCEAKQRQTSITGFLSKPKENDVSVKRVSIRKTDYEEMCPSPNANDKAVSVSEHGNYSETQIEEQRVSPNINNLVPAKVNQASAWRMLLKGPPKPPKCTGHQEICLVRTVQKEGANYGRQFFVCPRPMGDKNNKEARCDYFKWTVDTKQKLGS